MKTCRELRQRFIIALSVLGGVCFVCLVYLLIPSSGGEQGKVQKDAARQQLRQEQSQVTPLRGLDQKLVRSKQDIVGFYNNRLPDRYSLISQTLNELANKNKVELSNITYHAEPGNLDDVHQVTMRATLTGDYADVIRYIDAVDHSKIFFLIENVGVSNTETGVIQLQLTLSTFLKAGPTA
jgi:type IV pilus assembly protein PilO